MTVATLFFVIGVILFLCGLWRKFEGISAVLYLGSILSSCVVAWSGMDFSPSFSAIFLFVFYILLFLSECAAKNPWIETIWMTLFVRLLSILGVLFIFPSVFIYAAGDDLNAIDAVLSVIGGGVVTVLVALFCCTERTKLPVKILSVAELFLYCTATLFALACGFTSVALLPYGFGLLLITTSRVLKKKPLHEAFVFVGLLFCSIFLWAPMAF